MDHMERMLIEYQFVMDKEERISQANIYAIEIRNGNDGMQGRPVYGYTKYMTYRGERNDQDWLMLTMSLVL